MSAKALNLWPLNRNKQYTNEKVNKRWLKAINNRLIVDRIITTKLKEIKSIIS
jgi:hypothetical protein